MARFPTGANGQLEDHVRLVLGGKEVQVAESYEVHRAYLTQPATFSLRLGSGDVIAKLIQMARPKTPFQLYIGDVLQQTGEVDGYHADSAVGATELTIHGRDAMAAVHDRYISAEVSFLNTTYASLVQTVLGDPKYLGLTAPLATSNAKNRDLGAGVSVDAHSEPQIQSLTIDDSPEARSPINHVQSKLGERYFEFLRRHLDRAGLFLTASVDGGYVLSRPNRNQSPIAQIWRTLGKKTPSNVISAKLSVDTSHRYSEIGVYARAGGHKFGRGKQKGEFLDGEMDALGYKRELVIRDANCSTAEQAEYLARRKIAEGCREGFKLEYVVRGHSAPALSNRARCVWAPDTIVDVQDDELGLYGAFWVESVTFRRPPTTTTLRLMRLQDMIFAIDDPTPPPIAPAGGLVSNDSPAPAAKPDAPPADTGPVAHELARR